MTAERSSLDGRPLPVGFPVDRPHPPIVAESGDPFGGIRIIDAIARLERGRAVRVDDLVDRLNATHLDWMFPRAVVVDALIALQSNWGADYRTGSGIVIDEGDRGATVTIDDTTRMDPWLVGQAERMAAECQHTLRAFARRDTAFGAG